MCSVTVEPKSGDLDEREEREITLYFTAHRPVSEITSLSNKFEIPGPYLFVTVNYVFKLNKKNDTIVTKNLSKKSRKKTNK